MHILVVDDEPLVLDTVVPFLIRCGHDAVGCSTTTQATALLGNQDGAIDLLLTDVCMPHRDGVSLLHQVRQRFPDIDFILMTGHSQIVDLRQAVEEGAAGFLRKPLKLAELRVLTEKVAVSRADRTHIYRLSQSLGTERSLRENMTRERMFARRLHQRIFPTDFSWLSQTKVAIRHLPQAGLGGDYMDIRPYGPGKALIFVADVSGHGMPAAFGGIALKTWFSSLEIGLSPVDVLARADGVMRDLFPGEYYATAFCAGYEEATRHLTFASAGHPAPLVCSSDGQYRILLGNGAALGTASAPQREALATTLAEDDILIAYTDGLTDDLAALVAPMSSLLRERLRTPGFELKDILTTALDVATTASPLHSFGDDISLLALQPQQRLSGAREVTVVGKYVLHIEDDPVIRNLVDEILSGMGMHIGQCAVGAAALPMLAEHMPELVILDLVLPDVIGHVLFRQIRQRYPHLPVLVVTGHEIDQASRQCFDLNPAGILTKPVDIRELQRAVITALQFDPDRDLVAFDNLGNEWFDFVISSSMTSVELLIRYLQAIGRQPLPETVLTDLIWCIREMAMNGIEWGNRFSANLKVRVSTLILVDRVMVKIADEGGGFDTHRLFDAFDPEAVTSERERVGKRCGGFGLAMVQAKMSRVEFNQRGNVVLLVKEYNP